MLNTVKDSRERIGRMLLMHANHREDIKEARAGDIVALVGLKNTTTGDTLCDPDKPVVLERMEFPEPVIEVAVEPKTKADQEKMVAGAGQAGAGGSVLPRLDRSGERPDHHQGHGRAPSRDHGRHRMKREFKVDANVGAPQVAYRETITKVAEHDYTHKKQTGGSGQFARVKLRFEPLPAGGGYEFENDVVGGSVPRNTCPGVEKGLRACATPACSPASR